MFLSGMQRITLRKCSETYISGDGRHQVEERLHGLADLLKALRGQARLQGKTPQRFNTNKARVGHRPLNIHATYLSKIIECQANHVHPLQDTFFNVVDACFGCLAFCQCRDVKNMSNDYPHLHPVPTREGEEWRPGPNAHTAVSNLLPQLYHHPLNFRQDLFHAGQDNRS